eukprot:1185890-Prorocentrum_minimum.AAC.1
MGHSCFARIALWTGIVKSLLSLLSNVPLPSESTKFTSYASFGTCVGRSGVQLHSAQLHPPRPELLRHLELCTAYLPVVEARVERQDAATCRDGAQRGAPVHPHLERLPRDGHLGQQLVKGVGRRNEQLAHLLMRGGRRGSGGGPEGVTTRPTTTHRDQAEAPAQPPYIRSAWPKSLEWTDRHTSPCWRTWTSSSSSATKSPSQGLAGPGEASEWSGKFLSAVRENFLAEIRCLTPLRKLQDTVETVTCGGIAAAARASALSVASSFASSTLGPFPSPLSATTPAGFLKIFDASTMGPTITSDVDAARPVIDRATSASGVAISASAATSATSRAFWASAARLASSAAAFCATAAACAAGTSE